MNAPTCDAWAARLSDHVDGELDAGERAALEAHLAGCASCRALLGDLRRLVVAARALPAREPERDLWPAIERELSRAPRRAWPRWLLAFAAGILAAVTVLALWRRSSVPARVAAAGESYLLLLHEDEDFGAGRTPEEHARLVERYARWARDLGSRCSAGDELDERAVELRPGTAALEREAGPRIGGFFRIEVADSAEALEVARSCPHLEQGGWIELRRVRTH
jgi:hypothetical protein